MFQQEMNFLYQIILIILLFSETYHILGHVNVLFRISPPNRSWFRDHRIYFLWDMMSPLIAFILTRNLIFLPFTIFHFISHIFYVITWNDGYYANRISEWSSEEYKGNHITVDFFLTIADILSHCVMFYSIVKQLG